jgi:hypothetical protein
MAFQQYLGPFVIAPAVYHIPIDVFLNLPIKRWKYNRPADELRVSEIRGWMKTSKRMDGIIYLACIDNELVCYESNHRREALIGVEGLSNILVSILWNVSDDVVKEEFIRINKAISVPELYTSDETRFSLEDLRIAVDGFCETYKSLRVSSKHPQRPNFTRDMITDEFYRIMKEEHIDISELVSRLTRLNNEMATRDKSKLRPKVIQKCEESGMWLFAWSNKISF